MISIRPLLMLFVLSTFALGCSKEEPKKIPAATPEQKAAADKSHDEAKKKMESTAPAPAK
jgi:hypothetical protein